MTTALTYLDQSHFIHGILLSHLQIIARCSSSFLGSGRTCRRSLRALAQYLDLGLLIGESVRDTARQQLEFRLMILSCKR